MSKAEQMAKELERAALTIAKSRGQNKGHKRKLDESVVVELAREIKPLAYSMREAATLTGLSYQTIRREVVAGRLPAFYLGPQVCRIHRDDLNSWWTGRTDGSPLFTDEG
jgi:excisionase family DNA binding protein